MTWMVEYAGMLLSRHRVRPDGRTAFEVRRGRKASQPISELGEKILYLPLKTAPHRKFQYGIYVGIQAWTLMIDPCCSSPIIRCSS